MIEHTLNIDEEKLMVAVDIGSLISGQNEKQLMYEIISLAKSIDFIYTKLIATRQCK